MLGPGPLELAVEAILRNTAREIAHAIRAEVANALVRPPNASRSRTAPAPMRHAARPGRPPAKLVPLRAAVAELERDHIRQALDANGDSVIRAARTLGVPVTTLKYKLAKYRLR